MRLLAAHDKMSIPDVAKMLHISQDAVQSWIDFLVEEKILGLEYKFTVPYVYLNAPVQKPQSAPVLPEKKSLAEFKIEFNDRAQSALPQSKGKVLVIDLWQQHLQAELERKKAWFISEAKKRNLPNPEAIWTQYQKKNFEV